MDQIRREKLTYACILIFAVCLYMAKPWDSTLQAMDSAIHARYALEVTRNGSWIPVLPIPKFFPENAEPYFNDHPFLPFFIVGHFMRAFGANAWGARFLPSLFGGLNVGLVICLSKKLSGYRASLLAGIAMLLSPLTLQFTARFQLDPFLIFFTLLSFLFAYDRKFFWAGMASGLAVCFKSPVGWLILPTVFLFERFKPSFWKMLLPAIGLPLLLWLSANFLSHEPLLQDYWTRQVFGTAVGGRNHGGYADLSQSISVLKRNAFLPGSLLLIALLWEAFKTHTLSLPALKQRNVLLTGAGFLIFWTLISLMRFKFAHYFLPGIPLVIIFLCALLKDRLLFLTPILERLLWCFAPLTAFALLILPIQTAPESFPALKFFAAQIQSSGTEGDRVLFIENKEPYGTSGDYFVETAFYTERKFYAARCDEANAKAGHLQPEWIMTSGSNPFECLGQIDPKLYPSVFRFGNQYLLGKMKPADSRIFDFTPQLRALRAPIDGQSTPLPKDIYYRYE
jgi:4-amino-4-deoxy-L-arabinose transferase-like glycosyltransferase